MVFSQNRVVQASSPSDTVASRSLASGSRGPGNRSRRSRAPPHQAVPPSAPGNLYIEPRPPTTDHRPFPVLSPPRCSGATPRGRPWPTRFKPGGRAAFFAQGGRPSPMSPDPFCTACTKLVQAVQKASCPPPTALPPNPAPNHPHGPARRSRSAAAAAGVAATRRQRRGNPDHPPWPSGGRPGATPPAPPAPAAVPHRTEGNGVGLLEGTGQAGIGPCQGPPPGAQPFADAPWGPAGPRCLGDHSLPAG